MNELWGFVDWMGKEVVPLKYQVVKPFSKGLAAVKLNGKWGFINKTGEEVIRLKFDDAKPFSKGLAAVKLGGKWDWPGGLRLVNNETKALA